MKRLLLINWRDIHNPLAGGAEVHLHEVAKALVSRGYDCIQISHRFKGAPEKEIIDGLKVYRTGGSFTFNFTVWFNIARWTKKLKPDVIIDDSNKVPFFLPLLTRVPVVAQIHHLFGKVLFQETNWVVATYIVFLENLMPFVYRNVQVLTGSESAKQEFLRKGFKKVDIAPEGADLKTYRVLPEVKKISGRIAYIGRIKRYKRLEFILKAVAALKSKYPGIELKIAGSGDDIDRLKALTRQWGLSDQVEFLGFVSEQEKVELYNSARIAVNSSIKEGWGLTSIEANACGTPMVATDVPGLCDSVRTGETGFLVPFADAGAFERALDQLLENDDLMEKMRENGLVWASRHQWNRAVEKTLEAVENAIKQR